MNLLGIVFLGYPVILFVGPLSLIAMLPAVVYRNLAGRIVFWLLAATFLAWQMFWWSGSWSELMFLDPVFTVLQGSMWFLYLILVWRAVRVERKTPT